MIKELSIRGFKCFDNINIKPKALTLLVGKNSTGKSTVIQSVLALKQCGANPFRGLYMNIGEVSELMNANIGTERIEIKARYDSAEDPAYTVIEGYDGKSVTYNELASEMVYCSAERVGVKDTYCKSLNDDESVGTDCRYAFSYLCKHKNDKIDSEQVYDQNTLLTLGGQVDYWLSEICGYMIDAEYLNETDFVKVRYKSSNDSYATNWNRPQNVGTGVTYVASIIIASFSCPKDGLLIIENPEIHLHPSAQSKLLEFLSFVSLCDRQVIIETHSDHIFNGLRKCVHNNLIGNDGQSIFFFKDNGKGCMEPALVKLEDDGRISENTEGLFDQIQNDLDIILGW